MDRYFGLNVLQLTTPWSLLSFGSYRFWDNGCRWGLVNTADRVFNWTHIDKWIALLTAHGVDDAVFEFSGTPIWASSTPHVTNCDYEPGSCGAPLGLNPDGTGNNLIWRRWVAEVSAHLAASKVCANFAIWNEFGRQPTNPTAKSISWAGTNRQLTRMAEDARCIIGGRGSVTATKETAQQVLGTVGLKTPTSTSSLVLSPSIGVDALSFTYWQNYVATAGALEAAEVVAIHTYDQDVQRLHSNVARFKSSLVNKPLWSTEGSWGQTPPQDPAAYVTDYIALLKQAGVERFYWYAYDNPGWGTLWTQQHGLTAAGEAYKRSAEGSI